MKVNTPTRSDDAKSRRLRRGWAGPHLFVTTLVAPLVYSNATIDPVLLPRFLVVSFLAIVVVATFGARLVRSSTTPHARGSGLASLSGDVTGNKTANLE